MTLNKLKNISLSIGILLAFLLQAFGATAMDASRHADQSRLAQGKWVKVSVARSGMQYLSRQALSSMGFSSPENVRVFGYGGSQLPDVLDPETYIDDLPPVATLATPEGVYFYGVGPRSPQTDTSDNITLRSNPFSLFGYYFLTDSETDGSGEPPVSGNAGISGATPATTFIDVIHHETDSYSPGETGHFLVGEDLRFTPTRSFTFTLTDPTDAKINVGASIFANIISPTSWSLEAQGKKKTVAAPATSSAAYVHGTSLTAWFDVENNGQTTVNAKVSLAGGSANIRQNANLDWIAVNYERRIKMPDNGTDLAFSTSSPAVTIAGANASTRVWDVTDPLNITAVNTSAPDASGNISFTSSQSGRRDYVAFSGSMAEKLAQPAFVEKIDNQDLHALQGVDMIIFAPQQWASAAQNLARYRNSVDGLTIEVVDPEKVYNEFSSGSPDVNAFRKLLKMLYDRAGEGKGTAPQYALLFGRSTFDNRLLTHASANINYKPLPQWQTELGNNDNTTYPTDDIIGFLDDYSGKRMGIDTLNVAIGRLPVTSLVQANLLVDKIIEYETASPDGNWRSRAVFLADDDNNAVHMIQTETMIDRLRKNPVGANMLVDKIYIDAYEYVSGVAVGGREEFYRALDEGTVWVNYVGHANPTTLSSEGILNYSDMGTLYLKKVPFIYAATCEFMRWDAPDISGAERLALTKGGGVIGAITATRPVYISSNGLLTAEMGTQLMRTDAEGRILPVGKMLKNAKNTLKNDENKLRYGLLGDPSMRLRTPSNHVVVETINGTPFPLEGDKDAVLQARQDVTMTGSVRDAVTGEVIDDFNGSLSSTLYDADVSVTTLGHGNEGTRYTFDKHGLRLFAGTDTIVGGRFTLNMAMPAEVADNYRPSTLALYAADNDGTRSASALERRLFVYGTDEEASPDTVPPVIEALYLNHPSFKNGNPVNSTPMLIAEISDNHAINMSLAGIGHWMSLSLDEGAVTYNDVSNFYQPQSIERGTLYYQLEGLDDGVHTLTLRIWDSAGNSASETIEFFVDSTSIPQVFDIYTDKNPASETANFYLVHDRPDGDLKVEFMVYDMLGRIVWTNSSTGRADKYRSYPVTWNLTDNAGRRVPRGIYLYRAVVSDLNGKSGYDASTLTPTKKIAVTAR